MCQNRLSALQATAQREEKLGATRSSKPAKSVGQYRWGHSRRVRHGNIPSWCSSSAKGRDYVCGWVGGGGWGSYSRPKMSRVGKEGKDGAAGPTRKVASSHNSSRTSLGPPHGHWCFCREGGNVHVCVLKRLIWLQWWQHADGLEGR